MSELNQVIGVHVYECGWVGRHMQYVIYRKISDLTIQTDKEFKFIKRLSRYKLCENIIKTLNFILNISYVAYLSIIFMHRPYISTNCHKFLSIELCPQHWIVQMNWNDQIGFVETWDFFFFSLNIDKMVS